MIFSLLDNGNAKSCLCVVNCPHLRRVWRLFMGAVGQNEGLNKVHQNRGIIDDFQCS